MRRAQVATRAEHFLLKSYYLLFAQGLFQVVKQIVDYGSGITSPRQVDGSNGRLPSQHLQDFSKKIFK